MSQLRPLALVALVLGTLVAAGPATASSPQTGRQLYGLAYRGGSAYEQVVPFDVAQDGSLTERDDLAYTLPNPSSAWQIAVGRDARTVYVSIGESIDTSHGFTPVEGELDVLAVAADGSLSLIQTVPGSTRALAVSPDGRRLFATLESGYTVESLPIAGDGTLGAASAATPVGNAGALVIALSPTGQTLYASGGNGGLFQFAVGADGALTPRSPASFGGPCALSFLGNAQSSSTLDAICGTATRTVYAYPAAADGTLGASPITADLPGDQTSSALDVRGRGLFDGMRYGNVEQWQSLVDGSFTPFASPTFATSDESTALAADPSGNTLTAAFHGHVSAYAIGVDGTLTGAPADLVTATPWWNQLVYAPDQPPVANLTVTSANLTASFDARGSHAVDGAIARYDWDFGDGTTIADGGPTPHHSYALAGTYTATATLGDSAGCSVAGSFSGTGAICAGAATARATTTVHVTSPAVVVPPVVTQPEAPAPGVAPADPAAPAAPATPARALDATRTAQHAVALSWQPPANAPTTTRYLVLWSVQHSVHGPSGVLTRHRRYTTSTRLVLPRPAGHTVHVAVYAIGADGVARRVGKTTLRLRR